MKKLIIGGVVAAAMSLTPTLVMADNNHASGCGLGSMVLEGKSGTGWHIIASLLNGLGVNTFAMTSGTSNCDSNTVVMQEEMRDVFVAETFDTLSEEAARGEGSHVEVLAALSGVAEQDYAKFGQLMQSNYSELFSSTATNSRDLLVALDIALAERSDIATL